MLSRDIRMVLNIVLSLYSTRIALDALGRSDYGIYMLVAGITTLLTYLSNAMTTTTQRHIAYCIGNKSEEQIKKVFDNSSLIQWGIGLTLAFIMVLLTNTVFDTDFLNIETSKITEAKYVYLLMLATILITFVTTPYRAVLTAHENIVYLSFIDIADGVLKLCLVFLLYEFDNRLSMYACIMTSISIFHYFALALFCKIQYKESSIIPSISNICLATIKNLVNFATWTLYSSISLMLRTQGISIILNRIYGSTINAAYGIAQQVFGSITSVSYALLDAIAPQIIKAEGNNDRVRMLLLSRQASKYSFLLLSIFVIPLCWEMDGVLTLWLGTVPPHTAMFCKYFLIAALTDQFTIGLGTANQALGNIRHFSLIIYTVKLLTLPAFWILMWLGYSLETAFLVYIVFEAVSAIIRIPLLTKEAGLDSSQYIRETFLRLFAPISCMIAISYAATNFIPYFHLRFIITGCLSAFTGIIFTWIFALNKEERLYVTTAVKKRLQKQS